MAAQLRKRVACSGRSAQVVEAPGERLPFEDASFDSVAMTLVLCTAPDPSAVLSEVGRVLRPGGTAAVPRARASGGPKALARWQDRLHGPWYALGYGCNCNCATLAIIEAARFRGPERAEHGQISKAPPMSGQRISGVARASDYRTPRPGRSVGRLAVKQMYR